MSRDDKSTGAFADSMADLPVAQALLLDEACNVFETKWRAGGRPDIWATVLELPESLRPVALRELIQLDVYYRRQRGELPVLTDYAEQFHELDQEWLVAVVAGDAGTTVSSDQRDTLPLPPVVLGGGFGNYDQLEKIGQGAMGVVYRARDRRFNRTVAVKVLRDHYSPTSLVARRFVDEAKITGQLQHPGIPPVHEVGELPDGRPFIAMKLIRGRTLAAILSDGSMSRGELIATFEHICQAVAYAHS